MAFTSDITGQNVTGVTTNKGIFLSNNFGKNFTAVPETYRPNQPFSSVTASDDGSIQYAVVKNIAVLMSTNYGLNWTGLSTATQVGNLIYWNSVATNFNGSCVYAGIHLRLMTNDCDLCVKCLYKPGSNGAGSLYFSHNYGYNWTKAENLPGRSVSVYIQVFYVSHGQFKKIQQCLH